MTLYKYAAGLFENSYVFPTDNGWLYTVSFTTRSDIFKGFDSLANDGLTFEVQFERSRNNGTSIPGKDESVSETLQAILYNHITVRGYLPIYFYICDISDGKEASRAALFTHRYERMELDEWQLINYILKDGDDNDRKYYIGLLINVSHPNYEIISSDFEQFCQTDILKGKSLFRE